MARRFNGTSTQIVQDSSPVTGQPISMAAWVLLGTNASSQVIMAVDTNSGSGRFQMSITPTNNLQAVCVSNGGAVSGINSTATVDQYRWCHCVAIFRDASYQYNYINGVASSWVTGQSPTGMDRVRLGARVSGGTAGLWFGGSMEDAAVWNAELSLEQVLALVNGTSPLELDRGNLAYYNPLRAHEWGRNMISGKLLSDSGTQPALGYPLLERYRKRLWTYGPGAAGSSFKAAWAARNQHVGIY